MSETYFPALKDIMTAGHTLNEILKPTPLQKTGIFLTVLEQRYF